MARILTDFHHSSLLRATNMLFGDRLGMEVYRPIGMEWFEQGFWAINDQVDTARQYLEVDSQPLDNTPPLNDAKEALLHSPIAKSLTYKVRDPGGASTHSACTLEYFKQNQFDYVIASIPAHVALFERLIAEYQPTAKLIVQIGNEWPLELFQGRNVLASVKPRHYPDTNAMFYHQEFSTEIFTPTQNSATKKIYSFINCLEQQMSLAWSDFTSLEILLGSRGFEFRSFGGQCRDGNMNGPEELAHKMHEAMMIFHVKEGGDGFGHIIYNAYACGRPIITRRRFYTDRLAEELLVPGTFIDLDEHNLPAAFNMINRLAHDPTALADMGAKAARRFAEVVDYDAEAQKVREWLATL